MVEKDVYCGPIDDMRPLLDETFEILERAEKSRNEDPSTTYDSDFLLENARLLEENRDFSLARNIYQALIRRGLKIPECFSRMAHTYELENRFDEAIHCYEEAIAYASDFSYFESLSSLYIKLSRDKSAVEVLIHALGIKNINEEQKFITHKSLGNCLTRMGEYSKAEHHYRRAFELNNQSDDLQVNLGTLALQSQDHESATKHFLKSLEINGKNAKAISGLGFVEMTRENYRKAHDHFIASLEYNHNDLGVLYNLLKCALQLKYYDGALRILKKHIQLPNENPNLFNALAGIAGELQKRVN